MNRDVILMANQNTRACNQKETGISHPFEVIADFVAFMEANGQALEFPVTISQLAKTAQTTMYTVRLV